MVRVAGHVRHPDLPAQPPRCARAPARSARSAWTRITGDPDPAHVSTSFVERQNLTMRMSMRRFTRLTNAFSKKVENLEAAVALHFMSYNFGRVHRRSALPRPWKRACRITSGHRRRSCRFYEVIRVRPRCPGNDASQPSEITPFERGADDGPPADSPPPGAGAVLYCHSGCGPSIRMPESRRASVLVDDDRLHRPAGKRTDGHGLA